MTTDDSTAREEQVNAAIADYLEAVDAGRAPDSEEFIAKHPSIAAELRAFLADRQQFERFAGIPPGEPTLAPGDQHAAGDALAKLRYFGDYELLEEIARGGMGVVYKARQTSLKRTVAIKMILAGQLAGEEDVRRFHAEAEAAAKLDHPGIVPIFEVGEQAGQRYFSMAFVDGESLAHRIVKGVLAPREAAELMRKIAEAISYAHVEGVVHRDLKPANVLIDKDGQPRVTDFGLAKRVASGSEASQVAQSHLTQTGQVLGTPSYMAPEQAAGRTKEIGPLSDVYSLGAMLYCLLAGRPPFQAATPLDTILQVLEQEPVSPRQLNSSVPRDLETICMKCLEKEPRQRYASAQELVDDLQRFLNGEPIHARPIHAVERAWRWLRRQRRAAVVGTLSALAGVLFVVLGITGWGLYQRSQMAYLQLKAAAGDASVLVAELLDEKDEPAGASFTLPTNEPLAVAPGSYHLRVSGSGSLSETFLFDAEAGSEQSFTVSLLERKAPNPVHVGAPWLFDAANLDGTADFILVPHPYKSEHGWRMRRIAGATGKTVWEVKWDPHDLSAKEVAGLLKNDEDRRHWSRLAHAWQGTETGVSLPELWRADSSDSLPDLNGDGIGDLIWASSRAQGSDPQMNAPPLLLAVSGKDGKPLWWFRARLQNESFAPAGDVVCVPRLVRIEDRQCLIALFRTPSECWVEAISSSDGSSLWRAAFDSKWLAGQRLAQPYRPALCSVAGKSIVAAALGKWLVGLDATTGKAAWPAHDLGAEPQSAPQFADLDGDGSDDVLLEPDDSIQGRVLLAISLATRQPLWPTPAPVRNHYGVAMRGPSLARLADDMHAVVMQVQDGVGWNSYSGIEVRNGATGELHWERRFPIASGLSANANRAADRHVVGPDLDGDGFRELFVISTRADRMQRENSRHTSRYSLFVDALSGKDGHAIWWSRVPLGDVLPTKMCSGIGQASWGPPGPDGRPALVVAVTASEPLGLTTVSRSVFLFCTGTGRVLHVGQDLWSPITGDFNRDGITDLCSFVADDLRPMGYSEALQNPTGKLVVFQGTPPELWRRLGAWEAAADFDSDGQADLIKSGATDWIIASGRDGHIARRSKINWGVDGIQGHELLKFPLALPHGDLNGDGSPDVLFAASHQYFDSSRNRTNVSRPDRLFFPLQACSGKTGQRLWLAQDIADPVRGNHAYLCVKPYSPTVSELDGGGGADVLCPFSCYELGGMPGWGRQLGLARFSASDGKLRWSQMLEDQVALDTGTGGIANPEFTPPIGLQVIDLNADGVRDVLITVALREIASVVAGGGRSTVGVELIALDGRDGRRLWQRSLSRYWETSTLPAISPPPICGDLDGDGKPEVVFVESGGVSKEGWAAYKITALDGATGEPHWTWQYKNPSLGGDPLNLNAWPGLVLGDLSGDGRPSVCAGVQDRGAAEKPSIIVLDHRGEVRARFQGAANVWAADVDGDGRDELLYVADGKVRATHGAPNQQIWEWPLPGGAGGILDVVQSDRGKPATVIVEAAGESTYNHMGLAFLESRPPREGAFGNRSDYARGDSIFGLNGRSGRPAWRARRDPNSLTSIPAPQLLASAPSETSDGSPTSSAVALPTVVSRDSNRTVWQTILRAGDDGRFVVGAALGGPQVVQHDDPRLLRPLPWIPIRRAADLPPVLEFMRPPAYLALYSLLVLVIPGWLLLRGVLRRRWTLRGFLLAPVALGIAIVGYQFVTSLAVPEINLPRLPMALRLLLTVAGLPLLAMPSLLLIWSIRRRWIPLTWLLGASALISIFVAAITIWIGSRGMDSSEHYSWEGWYLVLVPGSYLAAALALAGMLVRAGVRVIRARRNIANSDPGLSPT